MARDHARVQVAIWRDEDFLQLDCHDQHMYLLLFSHPKLSYAGVLDYLPSRLANLAADNTVEQVENAVWRLEQRRYVVVDHDTHELLVRTYVRHDGLLDVPNVTKSMLKDRRTVLSNQIRDAIDAELRRAFRLKTNAKGWRAVEETEPELWRRITARPTRKGSAKGSVKGSDNPTPSPTAKGSET